jgi:hypothetical protein
VKRVDGIKERLGELKGPKWISPYYDGVTVPFSIFA